MNYKEGLNAGRVDDSSLDQVTGGVELRDLTFNKDEKIETRNAVLDDNDKGNVFLLKNTTRSGGPGSSPASRLQSRNVTMV